MSHPSRNLRQRVAGGVGVLVLASSLSACDLVNKPPTPDGTASALAAGLAGGDLNKVPFDGATSANVAAFLATAIGDLKDVKRSVVVSQLSDPKSNDNKATATLAFSWTLPSAAPTGGATASATATGSATSTSSATSSATPSATATATTSTTGGSDVVWSYTTTATLNRAEDKTWHVAWNPAIFAPQLTAAEKLTLTTVAAKRGDIVGAGSTLLMTQRDTAQVGIDKTKVAAAQQAAAATALAQLAGADPAAYAKAVTTAGAKAFVPLLTVRSDDPLLTSQAGAVAAIPGAVSIPGKSVIGPSPNFARSILGTVGEATAELVQKSNGALKPGDSVGLSGLEQRYDARLRGTPGRTIQAVGTDAAGKETSRDLFTSPAVDGKPLVVTLDLTAQTVAEAVLQGTPADVATSLVAIRPSTGEILAAANGPGSKGQAIGTTGQAEPGSTFKIVSALALLRAGLTPDSPVACTPTVNVGGRSFKNYSDYPADKLGTIPLRTAFANSCNTAFISNQNKVSQADLASAGAALGVGVDLDLGFPAYLGSIPTTATTTEHAASMIGQSKVLVAPMDMATVIASAVAGKVVRPRLVDDNPAVASFPTPDKPLQPAEAQALQSMLGAVVSEGSGALLASDGVTAAKTGTAEFGTANPPLTHAWMVAVKGDLAIAVYVEKGDSGSKTA
ncbi:MAG TPA: penicillin-binding transpeptidase domain-containing protein, partial [Lapillicoccus sp.]|nr:penicillin-binding transpeptidase domain-containing protein [Lapillicoccus sp.]